MTKITEKSWVTLGSAIIVFGGGGAWITRQEIQTSANAAQVQRVKDFATATHESLISIDKRLFAIEQILMRLEHRKE